MRETGKPVVQVARDLGINEGRPGNWVAKDRAARGEDERAGPARLRREVAGLAVERDVLKRPVALRVEEATGSR